MRLPQRLERFRQLLIPADRFAMTLGRKRFAMTNCCHCEEARRSNPMNLARPSFDEIATAVRTFPSIAHSRRPLRNDKLPSLRAERSGAWQSHELNCHCEELKMLFQGGNPMNLARPQFDEIATAVRTFPSIGHLLQTASQ